jgi:hypothetical protein
MPRNYEDRKLLLTLAIGLALLLVSLLLTFGYGARTGSEVMGKVVTFQTVTSEGSVRRHFIVRLDDGRVVRARVTGDVVPRVGARVRLAVTTSPGVGVKEFEFADFVDDEVPSLDSDE